MKKKQKTFAERARDLKKLYPRSEWDAIERKDLEKSMRELRDEQEQTRVAMGIADHADNMDQQEQEGQGQQEQQEQPQMRFGGRLNPGGYMGSYYDGYNDSQYLNTGVGNIGGMNTHFSDITSQGDNNNLVNASANNLQTLGTKFQSPETSMWPSAISAASSIIGDVASLRNYNKNMPQSISLPRMAPTKINLQSQREGLQRGYNTASNTMLRNSRDVSSPGNAYVNQIAGISALTDSLGNQTGQSYMNEANTNAQLALQVGNRNTEIGSREVMTNLGLKENRINTQNQYINSLSQTIPMALRDYRQQVNDTNMVDMSGKDFGLYSRYNPNMTFAEKMRLGILGPHYNIQSRYYANQNLRNR